MNNYSEIKVDFNSRRPEKQAWRARYGGHTTYAESREEAINLHTEKLEEFVEINNILRYCAESSAK